MLEQIRLERTLNGSGTLLKQFCAIHIIKTESLQSRNARNTHASISEMERKMSPTLHSHECFPTIANLTLYVTMKNLKKYQLGLYPPAHCTVRKQAFKIPLGTFNRTGNNWSNPIDFSRWCHLEAWTM